MTELTVKLNKTIEAPITKVFDAWLDPIMLAKFMLPMPGMEKPLVVNEAHEGGEFSIIMQVGENKVPHTGRYLVVDRPNKLAFTWESPASIDGSIITLSFTALSAMQTHIELVHNKFIDEQHRSNHEGGWTNILAELSKVTP